MLVGLPPANARRTVTIGTRGKMALAAFVHAHHEEIIQEFATFAATLMPSGAVMSVQELRDHAEELLTGIVLDMGIAQTVAEQMMKSQGLGRM
jgi:hypothetical protein